MMMGFDVSNPICSLFRRAAAHVEVELRNSADQVTKLQELVGTEVVVFRNSPSNVLHRDTLIFRTDAVVPVVVRAEVSAETQLGHMHRFHHGYGIWIERADRIGRHQGKLVHLNALWTFYCQSKVVRL